MDSFVCVRREGMGFWLPSKAQQRMQKENPFYTQNTFVRQKILIILFYIHFAQNTNNTNINIQIAAAGWHLSAPCANLIWRVIIVRIEMREILL